MKLTVKAIVVVRDGSDPTKWVREYLAPGTHTVERIPNPIMSGGSPWLVRPGTKIGLPQGAFYCSSDVIVEH